MQKKARCTCGDALVQCDFCLRELAREIAEDAEHDSDCDCGCISEPLLHERLEDARDAIPAAVSAPLPEVRE